VHPPEDVYLIDRDYPLSEQLLNLAKERRYMRTATAVSSRETANPQAGRAPSIGTHWVVLNDSPTELEIHSSADRLPGLILCQSGTEAIQEPVASSFSAR
jgi:hypothetical protein